MKLLKKTEDPLVKHYKEERLKWAKKVMSWDKKWKQVI